MAAILTDRSRSGQMEATGYASALPLPSVWAVHAAHQLFVAADEVGQPELSNNKARVGK
jgi:hypothetical protein